MAKPKTPDAVDRYLGNRFPTANPMLPRGTTQGELIPGLGSAAPGTAPVLPGGDGYTPGKTSPGGSAPPAAPLDWHAYLTNWGFSQDIVDELDRIFRTYSDTGQASAAALAYVRGTDWYKTTFPGISEGLNKGIISNEADYRAYTNQLNDLYTRYYGRNVTGAEVAKQLGSGYNVNRVGAALGGEAWAKANGQDAQYLLGAFDENGQASQDQLQSLGEENMGLDSIVGQQLQQRLQKAQKRFQGVFQGTLATPSMRLLGFGRMAAPSLSGGNSSSDVGA